MDIGGVIEAGMVRPLVDVQQAIAVRVLKNEMDNQKELISQVVTGPQQVSSQIYNGHGEIVPTPAGTSVDARV